MKRVLLLAAVTIALIGVADAGATDECDGLEVCVPVAGPWVIAPSGTRVPRTEVLYQLRCPRRYVVGGLDAELSDRAIDVGFLGRLGSPVNPGISTRRAVVFTGSYVGATSRAASFRPHIGCMPAARGGRIPTAVRAFKPGEPTVRRVRTVRVRPGSRTVATACRRGERLVRAAHALGFFTRTPPSASLAAGVAGAQRVSGRRVAVTVRADAELGAVRAVVQVHAVCARVR